MVLGNNQKQQTIFDQVTGSQGLIVDRPVLLVTPSTKHIISDLTINILMMFICKGPYITVPLCFLCTRKVISVSAFNFTNLVEEVSDPLGQHKDDHDG